MNRTPRIAALALAAAVALVGATGCQTPGNEPAESPEPVAVIDTQAPLGPQLLAALQAGDAATVQALLANGASVSEDLGAGNQAIHVAALASHADLIPILVTAGANVDAVATGQSTALMLAADRASAATVQALLDAGADPYLADAQGYEATAIHRAGREGNVEALQVLVNAGVDVDLLEGTNAHALMYAAFNGEVEAVEFLIDAGSNLEQRDNAGRTSYEWAVLQGNDAVASVLAAAGADTDGP